MDFPNCQIIVTVTSVSITTFTLPTMLSALSKRFYIIKTPHSFEVSLNIRQKFENIIVVKL